MGILEDCQTHFDTTNLYEVLDVEKTANAVEIKKAYRKLSLKFHPDRHADASSKQIETITAKFQVLSKVHFILSDEEKRTFYDDTGLVAGEDSLDGDADWEDYWRLLFPKVTTKDIDQYMDKYIGSEEEKSDLKSAYIKYEGNMDKIYEAMIGFDEDRHRDMLVAMIDEDEVPEFESFTGDTDKKRSKRRAKSAKEAQMAKKEKAKRDEVTAADDDLVKAIQTRSKGNFNSMIANLEAKYGGGGKTQNSPKRSKSGNSRLAKKKK